MRDFEFKFIYITYTTIEVIILSIILGNCPPGNDVDKAHKIPATTPVTNVILKSLVIIMDKIIKTNKKSGFTPKIIPGVI